MKAKKQFASTKKHDPRHLESNPVKSQALIIFLIVVITAVAFIPSLKNGFMDSWDDNVYITGNTIVTSWNSNSLKEIFTKPVNGTYVPLPLLTFALEDQLFGLNPLPYHITNLLLHLLCTVLVFYFLRLLKLDVLYAAAGALLAGIHPMRVESVAWITERKDLLYGLFYLASMIFYTKSLRLDKKRRRYQILCIVFFILSLFSKIQAVTLPLSLLLIDYLFERPLKIGLILEKIPFIVLSLLFGIVGIYLLRQGGVLRTNELVSPWFRIIFGFYSLLIYLVRFIVPFKLSTSYPYPVLPGASVPAIYYFVPFFVLLLGILVFWSFRKNRVIIFCSLFFLFNVVFMLQILAAGSAFLADRFTYIPYIGLFFLSGWGIEKLSEKGSGVKMIVWPAFILFILFLGSATFQRCKVWENGDTLWSDVISKYPDKLVLSYVNRGDYYNSFNQKEKSMDDYNHAVALNPMEAMPRLRRGMIYYKAQNYEGAISDYTIAIKYNPKDHYAYQNLCAAYIFRKEYDSAIIYGFKGLAVNPNNSILYGNIGYCYLDKEDYYLSLANFQRCLKINPENFDALIGLSMAYFCLNDKQSARVNLQRAENLQPLLKRGTDGVKELERSGVFYTDKETGILKRMFTELQGVQN